MTHKPNLVPTPIVDRNGKRTTVHKKASTSGMASVIPPVAISSAVSVTGTDIKRFMRHVSDYDTPEGNLAAAQYIKDNDPQLLLVANDIQENYKGGQFQTEVDATIATMLTSLKGIIALGAQSSFYPDFKGNALRSTATRLLAAKYTQEVIEDLTPLDTFNSISTRVRQYNDYLAKKAELDEPSYNPDYWKGVAMLAVANVPDIRMELDINSGFLPWLAHHESPMAVISVIKERRTVDRSHIEDILSQSNKALNDGAL